MNPSFENNDFKIIVIAASLGGIQALKTFVSLLPGEFPVPMVVVQHLWPRSPSMLDQILRKCSQQEIRWAKSGIRPVPGTIYLAPPGEHTTFDEKKKLKLSDSLPLNHVKPAADALFVSAARAIGERTIGVVLTGKGSDGAIGARVMKQAGGRILVQDPCTSQAPDMPNATLAHTAVDFILPLDRLASALVALCMVPGADRYFYVPSMYSAHLDPAYRYRPNAT